MQYEGDEAKRQTVVRRVARRREMMQFAHWLERNFQLKPKPRIDSASQAEVIYANVLARIKELAG